MSHLFHEAASTWALGTLLGTLGTVACFVAFSIIVLRTLRRANDASYAEAARLPLYDAPPTAPASTGPGPGHLPPEHPRSEHS
jgi:cbb3-type cytochrome oxidase subunit 3